MFSEALASSPVNAELWHDEVAGLLSGGDHRYTSGRRRVVDVLNEACRPVTIPEILETDGDLAQSSVYRSLTILEEVGAVTRIVTNDDHARFELAEALTDRHHHHLICTKCGSVDDFELPGTAEDGLDRAFSAVAEVTGFRVDAHRLDLLGICASCD